MIPVRWTPDALTDLDRIDTFNVVRSESWATRVRNRITARCDSVAALPRQGRPVGDGLRALPIPDIQYVVFYEPEPDAVTIRRVFHAREQREQP